MKKSKGDRFLELSLYVFSLCLFFAYFFISLSRWNEFSFLCIFCGFFFYLSLVKLVSKRKKRKFDYVMPILCLGISIPGGYAFDYMVNAVIHIWLGMNFQLALLLSIGVFCLGVGVLGTAAVLIGLMFWEELFFKKE